MRNLIVNADGYGFTEGVTRAIEECVAFGTVKSVSVLANFPLAEGVTRLLERFPDLSVGCHLNPVVGRPLLPPRRVPSLVDDRGEFLRGRFLERLAAGALRPEELRAELTAQVERLRVLAGANLTHIDFQQGLENQPRLYPLFLDVAVASGVGRIRTHKYHFGLHHRLPGLRHGVYLLWPPMRLAKYVYNSWLRRVAKKRCLAMPDLTFSGHFLSGRDGGVCLPNYLTLLRNLPPGTVELIAHPAYVDASLRLQSKYLEPRELEREILLDPAFRQAVRSLGINLIGYGDIPVTQS
jgi:predicted glycoside hydrolase/deacetylase ChbG (UPF0249 family)